MLTADVSVVGVYKCLCSLLSVLVLLLLEIDLKRVYFDSHWRRLDRHVTKECFPTQGIVTVFRYVFAAERRVTRTSESVEVLWRLDGRLNV